MANQATRFSAVLLLTLLVTFPAAAQPVQSPARVGVLSSDPPSGDPARWFDPAAFVLQPAGYYGNVPRNALTGPGFANLDLSLGKHFSLGEPREFEFRADFFNLSNRPNFATPSSGTGAQIVGGVIVFPDASGSPAGNAGQIFRTVTDSRQIQFSLRFRF